MKYGIVYAYWSNDWEGDYIPAIKRAAACGFDVLEIFTPMLLTLTKSKLDEIKAVAKEYNIELTYLIGLPKEYDLSSEEEGVRNTGVAYVKKILEVIHYLGGNCFSGINFCAWSDFNGEINKQRRLKNSVESMKKLASIAEDYGISYNLEVTNRFEQFILNTSAEALEYTRMVGSPNVNILLDVFHMNIEEDSMYEAIRTAGAKLGHFHVGTNNRRPPRDCMVNWNEVAKGLKEVGYDKVITLEPLVKVGGTVALDSKVWRDMTNHADEAQMDTDAKAGLAYMKNLMR